MANKKTIMKKTVRKVGNHQGNDTGTDNGKQLWTFPKNSLEEALRVAKAIEEKNAGNPMQAADLVLAVGYSKPSDWRFKDLLRSANFYGLTSGTGATAKVNLEELGQDILTPSTPKQRVEALYKAFFNVPVFKDVHDYYRGRPVKEDEFFINNLIREFKIPKDRVDVFTKVYVENSNYLKPFIGNYAEISPDQNAGTQKITNIINVINSENSGDDEQPASRQYLDTCFVMMPFGPWFDRYYKEIYVPAIKAAGFEPVRGDELFNTGSVVEQIWDQIVKAKLLLADLSGKNPNVFYELGLAHAAIKPVIFTASTVEDVPFDLRHLRVIVYDIREPKWSEKLQRSITDYLKNASKEPQKSIPHPFRQMIAKDDLEAEEEQ